MAAPRIPFHGSAQARAASRIRPVPLRIWKGAGGRKKDESVRKQPDSKIGAANLLSERTTPASIEVIRAVQSGRSFAAACCRRHSTRLARDDEASYRHVPRRPESASSACTVFESQAVRQAWHARAFGGGSGRVAGQSGWNGSGSVFGRSGAGVEGDAGSGGDGVTGGARGSVCGIEARIDKCNGRT